MTTFDRLSRLSPHEFSHPEMLDTRLLVMLDAMIVTETRYHPGLRFIVHSDYRPGDKGEHGMGRAIDGHFEVAGEALPVVLQFIMACRYSFSGIGMYPFWHVPGIHIDVRPRLMTDRKHMWWRTRDGEYKAIETYFEATSECA